MLMWEINLSHAGVVRWEDAASSGLGWFSGASGVVVGGGLVVGGGGLMAVPEPTLTTKVAGVTSIMYGLSLVGKSSADFTLNLQNFWHALNDRAPQVPSSLMELGAGVLAPGNQDAQLLAVAGNLGFDLMSGRMPVGLLPDLSTVGSALHTGRLANVSDYVDYQAAANRASDLPVMLGAPQASNLSLAIDTLQVGATGQAVMANSSTVMERIYPSSSTFDLNWSIYGNGKK